MSAQFILASASPRRKELLQQIGLNFLVYPVDMDESPYLEESPINYVQRMAWEKSVLCSSLYKTDLPILAADTIVVCEGEILGKPTDQAHATAMLRCLSGRSHQVYTAVSLRGKQHNQALNISEVTFKPLTDNEIAAYWYSGESADKAGAYGIQGLGGVFVQSIKGSFSGVMGLPVYETFELLSQEGIHLLV